MHSLDARLHRRRRLQPKSAFILRRCTTALTVLTLVCDDGVKACFHQEHRSLSLTPDHCYTDLPSSKMQCITCLPVASLVCKSLLYGCTSTTVLATASLRFHPSSSVASNKCFSLTELLHHFSALAQAQYHNRYLDLAV